MSAMLSTSASSLTPMPLSQEPSTRLATSMEVAHLSRTHSPSHYLMSTAATFSTTVKPITMPCTVVATRNVSAA